MKSLFLSLALVGVLAPMVGCETLADTKSENAVRVKHAMIMDLRQLPNDLEYVGYLDRPVWLSRYPIPND